MAQNHIIKNKYQKIYSESDDDYVRLGSGSYADVFKVTNIQDKKNYALKQLREKTNSVEEKVFNDYLREATNLSGLQHSNIIEFIECFTFKNKFYIVMELCEGGNLQKKIIEKKLEVGEPVIKKWLMQAASALNFIQIKGLIHRDLKPLNIFLKDASSLDEIKIGDFGLATLSLNTCTSTGIGTIDYSAPELMGQNTLKSFNSKTDIWALGATFYALCCFQIPFTIQERCNPQSYNYKHLDNFSYELNELLRKMLLRDPKKRIDVQSIIQGFEIKKKIFISYSHENQYIPNIASKLKEKFQVWIDIDYLKGPENQDAIIEAGILSSDLFVPFVSKDYCLSRPCIKEYELAERDKKMILPVMIENIEKMENTKGMRLKVTSLRRFYAYKRPKTFNPWNEHSNECNSECIHRHSDDRYIDLVKEILNFFPSDEKTVSKLTDVTSKTAIIQPDLSANSARTFIASGINKPVTDIISNMENFYVHEKLNNIEKRIGKVSMSYCGIKNADEKFKLERFVNSKPLKKIKDVNHLSTVFTEKEISRINQYLNRVLPEGMVLNKLFENLGQGKVPEIFKKPKENEVKIKQYKCKWKDYSKKITLKMLKHFKCK